MTVAQTYQATGELIDDRTLKLDQALPPTVGKVRVTVEPLIEHAQPDLVQFVAQMWEAQRRRGHVPRTKEEIDASLKAERDSWDC